jgi:hypothetical protein
LRERERESLSSRSFGLKDFHVNVVANGVKGVETSFYRPHMESTSWGVRDSDMSGQETGYVQETLLEPSLHTGHVRYRDLTWVKVDGSDMSGDRLWNPENGPDKSAKRT